MYVGIVQLVHQKPHKKGTAITITHHQFLFFIPPAPRPTTITISFATGRMRRFTQPTRRTLSWLLLLIALASANAFVVPGSQRKLGASSFSIGSSPDRRLGALPNTALRQSSSGDSDEDDDSSTINIALICTSIDADDDRDALRTALTNHPFCQMTGVRLSVADVPASAPWTDDHAARLRGADIACFGTAAAVSGYLRTLDDDHLGVSPDASAEDRRKLPNRMPDPAGGAGGATAATLMAACPDADAGRECLNSGRWTSQHIYYPKETQGAVELKTDPIEGRGEEGGGEGDVKKEIDVDVWAAVVVQAAGDVMERKFWGDGW